MLQTVQRVARLRRIADSARQARDRSAREGDPTKIARALPPLQEWIPLISPHLDSPRHLVPLTAELERVLRGESIEVAVSVPPRHGKTTTIVHWIVWLLVQRPDLKVLYCSFGRGMATKQTRAMRALARRARVPLGEVQTAQEWTTAGGGSVKACGITGPPTGDGFDVIVVDDPHRNRRSAESPVERDGVNTAYRDDVYTRQHPPGAGRETSHVLVHTRWHEDDLIGQQTRRDEDGPEPFRLVNLPAISESGEALAPWMWPLPKLRKLEAKLGPYAWASLFQGSPRPKGGALFGAATWTDHAPTYARYAGGLDLARTAKTRSDHQAAVTLAFDPRALTITVVDIEYERCLVSDRVSETGQIEEGFSRRAHAMQRRWKNASFRMYAGGAESTLIDLLARDRDHPVFVHQLKAETDKWDRAQPCSKAWNAGRILILKSLRHGEELARQCSRFTGLDGDSDDLVDALVSAFDELGVTDLIDATNPKVTPEDTRAEIKPMAAAMRRRGVTRGIFT